MKTIQLPEPTCTDMMLMFCFLKNHQSVSTVGERVIPRMPRRPRTGTSYFNQCHILISGSLNRPNAVQAFRQFRLNGERGACDLIWQGE